MAERRAAVTSPSNDYPNQSRHMCNLHLARNPPTPFAVIKVCERGILPRCPYPSPSQWVPKVISRATPHPDYSGCPMPQQTQSSNCSNYGTQTSPICPDTPNPHITPHTQPNGVGGHPNPTNRSVLLARLSHNNMLRLRKRAVPFAALQTKLSQSYGSMIGTNALTQLSHPIINAVAKPSHTMSTHYRYGHCSHDRWCSALLARQERNHTATYFACASVRWRSHCSDRNNTPSSNRSDRWCSALLARQEHNHTATYFASANGRWRSQCSECA